eukprot:Hpha_TRINITY_DN11972_c0_g1::TRINITY_DN11972_c0_g1_i1::g.20774::m.20774
MGCLDAIPCFAAFKRRARFSRPSLPPSPSGNAAPQVAGGAVELMDRRRQASLDTPYSRTHSQGISAESPSQPSPEVPSQPSGDFSPMQHGDAEALSRHQSSPAEVAAAEGQWACPQCTFHNPSDRESCQMCQGPRAQAPEPPLPLPEPTSAPEPAKPEPVPAEDPVVAEEQKLDEVIVQARQELMIRSIRADDLEVDQENLAIQLQEARARLQALEKEEAMLAE